MSDILQNELYLGDIQQMADMKLPWEKLENTCVLIAGATGLIGRCLIDLLMYMNEHKDLCCNITAVSSNMDNAVKRFPKKYFESEFFNYVRHDISAPFANDQVKRYSYILHLASNTHPIAYAERPIDTILANVYGTKNLLDVCFVNDGCRFVFPSSVEIYGENRGDVEMFDEDYLGYINSNTLRAGYPESKRVCESLCQAYIKEKKIDAVIPRLPRIYGPTMQSNDSKAMAQFIRKAVGGENIVLKSDGRQYYSFLYVADAVTGILTTLFFGKNGEVYNVADPSCDGTLKDAAKVCASIGGGGISFDIPSEIERQGYSIATKARLDGSRIRKMGWKPVYDFESGIRRTIEILQQCKGGIL